MGQQGTRVGGVRVADAGGGGLHCGRRMKKDGGAEKDRGVGLAREAKRTQSSCVR